MLHRKQIIQILIGVEIVSVTVTIFGQQAQTITNSTAESTKIYEKIISVSSHHSESHHV